MLAESVEFKLHFHSSLISPGHGMPPLHLIRTQLNTVIQM
jgi:hypothetical protein